MILVCFCKVREVSGGCVGVSLRGPATFRNVFVCFFYDSRGVWGVPACFYKDQMIFMRVFATRVGEFSEGFGVFLREPGSFFIVLACCYEGRKVSGRSFGMDPT